MSEDTPLAQRRFRVLKRSEDVLGGKLSYANAYISIYPEALNRDEDTQERIKSLSIGEEVTVSYSLSGGSGTYTIRRVEDAEVY